MSGFMDKLKGILGVSAINRQNGDGGQDQAEVSKPAAAWNRKAVTEHFEKYFGTAGEIIENTGDIWIHLISPTRERGYYTLFTSGMSKNAMFLPEGMEGYEYAELMLHLPSAWTFNPKDPKTYWPVDWLKTLAYLPGDESTWLFYGHTIPNGENAEPFADNTRFGCFIIGTTNLLADDAERDAFSMLDIGGDKVVYCFTLFPIHKAEMDYKLHHSAHDLFSLFDVHRVSDVINVDRESLV